MVEHLPPEVPGTLEALQRMERELLEERRKLDMRISRVQTAREALTALTTDEPVEFEGGLADACRAVLKNTFNRSLSAPEIRDAILALGYDASGHSNLLASIHSVLKRMADSKNGEVRRKFWKNQPGIPRFYWVVNMLNPPPKPSTLVRADGPPVPKSLQNRMTERADEK